MPHLRFGLPIVLAAALAACGTPIAGPTAQPAAVSAEDGQAYPDGNPYRLLAVEELPIAGVTVDSELAGAGKARLADGNLSTQWSNGGYRNATAWAAAQLAASASIAAVAVKTGPTPAGTSYDLQVSADGAAWTTVASNLKNTTWNLETKALPAGTTGKHVRLFWRNSASAPQPHFAIYELRVDGTAGPGPTPSPTPSPVATPTPTPVPTATPPGGPLAKLTPVGATASSTMDGLTVGRAFDGDVNTQWASGEYKAYNGDFTLDYGAVRGFGEVRIKTGYLPGKAGYDLLVSDDGTTWRTASAGLKSTTWGLETKPMSATGRYLRVAFTNDSPAYIARFPIYEIEAWGRANPTKTTKTVQVLGAVHRTNFGPSVGINGTWQTTIATQAEAFDDKTTGRKFPAMLGLDHGRYGWSYGRITPENAAEWYGDIGGSGGVTFLDTAAGVADNAGSWIFTMKDFNAEIYPIEASATANVTTWRPEAAAAIDLGATPRAWSLSAVDPSPIPSYQSPAVVCAYKRPDGVWDFSFVAPTAYAFSGNDPMVAGGRVYLFYVTADPSDACPDADVTFSALD